MPGHEDTRTFLATFGYLLDSRRESPAGASELPYGRWKRSARVISYAQSSERLGVFCNVSTLTSPAIYFCLDKMAS